MDALKYPFKSWLINKDKKAHTTANGYISGLKYIEDDYNDRTGELFFFFDCKQEDIPKITGICKEYDTNGKYEFVGKNRSGAPISALKRYLVFLKTEAFTNQTFVLTKKSEKNDIWPFVSPELLKILFFKTVNSFFPGYEICRKAKDRDDEVIILENITEKRNLVVLLENGIADFITFGKISAKLPDFMELLEKDGIEVEGIIIAGKITDSLVQACKTNPKIKLQKFDLDLILCSID